MIYQHVKTVIFVVWLMICRPGVTKKKSVPGSFALEQLSICQSKNQIEHGLHSSSNLQAKVAILTRFNWGL